MFEAAFLFTILSELFFGPSIEQIESCIGRILLLCMLFQPKCNGMGRGSYSLGILVETIDEFG